MSPGAAVSLGLKLDSRLLEKPPQFSGTGWAEWSFKVKNFVGLLDPVLKQGLEEAEIRSEPVPALTGLLLEKSSLLYALLVTWLSGRPLVLIQGVLNHSGFEAWRVLAREYDSRLPQQRLTTLQELLRFPMGNDEESFRVAWAKWEVEIARYEANFGRRVDDELKVAVVLEKAPAQLRQHLLLNSGQFADGSESLKVVAMGYLQLRRSIGASSSNRSGGAELQVDFFTKGGKGGKGGKDGKERPTCGICGKKGHTTAQCWSKTGGKAPSSPSSSPQVTDKPQPKKEHSGSMCHRCGGKGHWARDCASAPVDKEKSGKSSGCGKRGGKLHEFVEEPEAEQVQHITVEPLESTDDDGKYEK
jgi:hypothetical protein